MGTVQDGVNSLVNQYFVSANDDLKRYLPKILSETYETVCFTQDNVFCLSFVGDIDKNRLELFKKRNKPLYPKLFTSDSRYADSSLMSVGSLMMMVSGFRVEPRQYAFYLKKDSSLSIDNLIVKLPSPVLGKQAYVLDLMYLVSYGSRIDEQNIVFHLEDFFRNSIAKWRARSA